jgi:hypothetical protein
VTTRIVATCGRCAARWTATRAAHCAGCHRTFSTVSGFDKHRRDGGCLEPAAVGLELRNGMFRGPQLPRDVLAARLGR